MCHFINTFLILVLTYLITSVSSLDKGVEEVKIVRQDASKAANSPQSNNIGNHRSPPGGGTPKRDDGLLVSWNASNSKADFIVAQDGSGNYTTINDAVVALSELSKNRHKRVVVYVKSGKYVENVEIRKGLNDIMFVGDGIDETVISGSLYFKNGTHTFKTATFGNSILNQNCMLGFSIYSFSPVNNSSLASYAAACGDGFWARDITFENTAGPQKHQAVALRVRSDMSVFYRCSFKGYQDTLFVQYQRQFYRDCEIYGTVDFIFGDAAVVFDNCDIFTLKPMHEQKITITAQGRKNATTNTGISIINSRVKPTDELARAKEEFKIYLGRPWKMYSRTVFIQTYLDAMVDKAGWCAWNGSFALSTLYYAEYGNNGTGASTENRVKWPGYHVLTDLSEANEFSVQKFIGGDAWIPASGVPFSSLV